MEKVFLKPFFKEILFKTNEPDVFFDSFEYGPRDDKNRHLGHLYAVGHVKFGEENMSYVLNLISSLAKREYYSKNGNSAEDPKKAFELTLKKLNDVLEDFFKNKDLKISLGLLAIAGEKIYISKLGKFKILLARGGEMIDILNNVDLFQREQTEEKQFSNIVSGKIQEKDKLFAAFPTRQLTAREKNIRIALAANEQEGFAAELASIHANSKSFPCCGFHIEIKKVKENEIPIRSVYRPSAEVESSPDVETNEPSSSFVPKVELDEPDIVSGPSGDRQTTSGLVSFNRQGNIGIGTINSSEMSVIKRGNIFTKINQKFSKFSRQKNPRVLSVKRNWIIGLVLVLAIGGVIFTFKDFLIEGGEQKSAIHNANENLKLAEEKLTQNDNTAARELLALSLSSITGIQETNKKVFEIKNKINALLDKMDLVSSKQPEPFFVSPSYVISQISATEEGGVLTALDQNHKALKINTGGATEISTLPAGVEPIYAFQSGKNFSIFNGLDQFGVLNTESGKYSSYTLKEAEQAKDAAIYEGNLYILGESAIYKYQDAVTGGIKKQLWLGGLTDPAKSSIAVDGKIYVLYTDGAIATYYKGKEENRVSLNYKFNHEARLLASKDSPYFYIADYTEKRVRVFDKLTGSLILTYKATQLPLLKKIALAGNALYFLTIDSQIWKISLQ